MPPSRVKNYRTISQKIIAMATNRFALIPLWIALLLWPCKPLIAQQPLRILVRDQQAVARPRAERGETVRNRTREELNPSGIRAGAFIMRPGFEVREVYQDNIFAQDEGEIDDFITLVSPNLRAESDWGNHQLNLRSDATIGKYATETSENFEDFSVGLDAGLDIMRGNVLRLGGSYNQLHEGRASPEDRRGVEPTVFNVGTGFLTYEYQRGRASLELDGSADRLEYDNGRRRDGSVINADQRNRTISTGRLRIGYEVLPSYTVFVRSVFDWREYDRLTQGLDRDSDGYLVELGTVLNPENRRLFGDIAIGYRSQDFDDPSLTDINTVTGGGALTWNPTELTTVTSTVTRDVRETTRQGSSSILSTIGTVVVDHELLRNLLLQARVFVTDEDFEGSNRSDRYTRAGFGADYLMNRYIYLSINYDYLNRDSNFEGGDFTTNLFSLSIRLQI